MLPIGHYLCTFLGYLGRQVPGWIPGNRIGTVPDKVVYVSGGSQKYLTTSSYTLTYLHIYTFTHLRTYTLARSRM